MVKSDIPHDSTNKQSARRLTIGIIYNPIGESTPSYMYMFVKTTYHKSIVLPIQYRLKVDYTG